MSAVHTKKKTSAAEAEPSSATKPKLPPLDDEERLLFNMIPEDGSRVGNTKLIRDTSWTEDKYYQVRQRLLDKGLLKKGVGRGGTVGRSELAVTAALPDPQKSSKKELKSESEASFYQPLSEVLGSAWAKDNGLQDYVVEVTAHQGRKVTGGRWSRPDLAVVALRVHKFIPGRYIEVWTFEVKPLEVLDVTAVYEALAHSRSATKSTVVCVTGGRTLTPDEEEQIDLVAGEARHRGIGLIVVSDPADYSTWDERVEGARMNSDPERVNEFIATQIVFERQDRILGWLR